MIFYPFLRRLSQRFVVELLVVIVPPANSHGSARSHQNEYQHTSVLPNEVDLDTRESISLREDSKSLAIQVLPGADEVIGNRFEQRTKQ